MIIPAVVIMAAAPVMVQAAGFTVPANATCVDGKALELTGAFTFNNLDFIEIHYTTTRTTDAEKINVKVGSDSYAVTAVKKGSEYVAKFLVKATNLAVPSISVSITGAGSIVVTSASATTGVYQGLVTKHDALVKKLTALRAYPANKKVEKVYDTADIEKLAQDLGDFKATLEEVYAEGVEPDAEGLYTTLANNLNYDNRESVIKANIDAKAKAIADANKEVADAISVAETELNNTNTTLRSTYADYTNDLARALQEIQKQRTVLTQINKDNGTSLNAQTSDVDENGLIARVNAVTAEIEKIKTTIATAKTEKDNAYTLLMTKINGVATQATDCPDGFTFKSTSFKTDKDAIEEKVDDARYKDDILSLDITTDINNYNANVALYNAAVTKAKAIKTAYDAAVKTINSVPSEITNAKNYINGRSTTRSYTDNDNGLTYSKTLSLSGKGAELAIYENSWKSSGSLKTDLDSKWTAAKKLAYTELGADGYTSPVETASVSIANQKNTDIAAIEALTKKADDLITAYNEVFGKIKGNAEAWTQAVNGAKGLLMYEKTGYTGYEKEKKSYAAQLADQKTAINTLISKATTAASTTKTIAQMLTDVKALKNIDGPSDWNTIAAAIQTLTATKADRELAFKGDALTDAKEAAEAVWPRYTNARTLDDFLAPTSVHQTVQKTLQDQYDALVKQYEDYQGYKNATVDAADYDNQLAHFKEVSEGASKFESDVNAYIAALKKAQASNKENGNLNTAATNAVTDARNLLNTKANNTRVWNSRTYRYDTGDFWSSNSSDTKYVTAQAYKNGRVVSLRTALTNLENKIKAANSACTLYDDWGHDNVKGELQTQHDNLKTLIENVDTDIWKAIELQNTANALEVASLKNGKNTEVVVACSSDFTAREKEIADIKSALKTQIESTATDMWVRDYETTFNTGITTFTNNKANLQKKLEGYQTQFNDRNTLDGLVKKAQTKIDAAWISPEFDAIEFYMKQLFAIEGALNGVADFVGNEWVAGTDYTGKLNTENADLQKYAAASNVTGSIDAIVAASKDNLAAKTALDEKAAELKTQLNNTISNLNANKIEVTKDGVTTTKDYTFKTEEEIAKKEAALAALNAFKNTAGEIFSANVAFSGKSVKEEIEARYKEGQAATKQDVVETGILAFYTAINDVMVNLEKDYAGIVTAANEAVKTAFGTAYAAHTKAYNDAIAELQEYQNLPAGDFRDQVMVSLTKAVTDITAEKAKADAKNTSFTANDATLIDADGYYDKGETAKTFVKGCTTEIGNILSKFTADVDDLAVTAFDEEIATATAAYNTAKEQVTSENGWTITTADFADVKKLIDRVQKAFDTTPTALNYGAQVNALNDTAEGYAALIAADKVKYAEAQFAAYKKIGKDKADAAKTTVNGYKHLTAAHKSALISGIEGVLSTYETNLTKGVSDLWSGMATVKTNSTDSYKYTNTTLDIYKNTTNTIDGFCKTITDKALAWDTADWNTTVCNGLKTELAKVSAIYTTLNGKGYAVLTDAADLYEGWDTAAGTGQKRSDLQGQLDALNTWCNGVNTELGKNHDRSWLAEVETEKGDLRTQIATKYASLTGKNDIVAVFDAANSAYTTWKNNKVLEAYKQTGLASPAFALAESWIPQNYKVSETADYTAIVAKVQAVKAAIAAAKSAEEVDYLAFGKGTGTGDNIPALLVVIDNHSDANTLVADMAADTKAAIEGFKSALAAEKTEQAGYEEGAKSNFSEVDTKLKEVDDAYDAALGNGTLVFADVQKALTDAVSSLTSQLNTLATTAANENTILVKTKDNEAGWTKVQGEYAEFEKVYNAAVEELDGYADVKANYTATLANYLADVKKARTSAQSIYNAFNNSTDKLNATGLSAYASIKNSTNEAKRNIEKLLKNAKAAQHAYNVQQACARLAELNDKLEAYWSTANNTLTNYNTTVQESFADEKQAVLDEMEEVKSNIADGENALANETALTTQIRDLYGKIDNLLALAAENNKGAAGTGDVVGDGIVDLDDYDAILNYILGTDFSDDAEEQAKAVKAADVNRDNRVNVADLQGVLNIYHYGAWNRTSPQSNSRRRMAAYFNAAADNMEAEISGAQGMAEIALNLDNRQAYTSFQFDVKLPEGMQFDLVSLTERAEGLDVQTGLLEDGTIRVVTTATDATIAAGTGAVARLSIATEGITDGEIVIDNIVFADNFANAKTFNGFALTAGTVTGIAGNASLTQRVVRSIYNAGGQLMDKVQQGINILVGEDGAAKKVIKK